MRVTYMLILEMIELINTNKLILLFHMIF